MTALNIDHDLTIGQEVLFWPEPGVSKIAKIAHVWSPTILNLSPLDAAVVYTSVCHISQVPGASHRFWTFGVDPSAETRGTKWG